MVSSTLFAVVSFLSSLVAVNGGVVVQRQGTFTFLTPQPTATNPGATTSASNPTTSSTVTPSSTSPITSSTVTSPTTTPSTTSPATSSTVTYPTTTPSVTGPATSSVVTYPTTTPSITISATSPTVTYPTSASVTVPITVNVTTTSALPPVTKTTTLSPSPTATGVNCNGIQQWQAALAYISGNQVIYNGQIYTARQWTYNNAPPAHPDQWAAAGTCAQPVNNQANCNGVGAWQSTAAYSAGNQVTYNNHLWSAVQWTQSNTPGDTSGTWKDQGACA